MQKRVKSGVFRPMTFPFILALYMVAVLLGLSIKLLWLGLGQKIMIWIKISKLMLKVKCTAFTATRYDKITSITAQKEDIGI